MPGLKIRNLDLSAFTDSIQCWCVGQPIPEGFDTEPE
jgi:hypothetical protein